MNMMREQFVERRYFHFHSCGLLLQRLFSPLGSASVFISADPIVQLRAHKWPGNDGALQLVWQHRLISIHILSWSFAAFHTHTHSLFLSHISLCTSRVHIEHYICTTLKFNFVLQPHFLLFFFTKLYSLAFNCN